MVEAGTRGILLRSVLIALCMVVALGLPYESRRGFDSEKPYLLLKIIGRVLAAMVVAKLDPLGHTTTYCPEVVPHRLPDGLQRLPPGRTLGGVDAVEQDAAVVHAHENRNLPARAKHRAGDIRAPHLVGPVSGNPLWLAYSASRFPEVRESGRSRRIATYVGDHFPSADAEIAAEVANQGLNRPGRCARAIAVRCR